MAKDARAPQETEGEARLVAGAPQSEEERFDRIFRPRTLDDFVGQEQHKSGIL